ncbi:MAG TPA: TIGR00725 family protein [Solirubrobacteraceae bacterium]|nr:TIGR00725 family protein [Solirubrobacteraceae bacterium]
MRPPRAWIAVVGPGSVASPDLAAALPELGATPAVLAAAEEVGAAVAEADCGLVCGGLGGVMEAACRGARSRGGLTLGLLPGLDREEANGWVVVAVATGLGEARNALVVRAADAVIAIGGGWGTLSEIALALKTGVPVVGLATWEPTIGGAPVDGIVPADRPRAAVDAALSQIFHSSARDL